MRRFAKSGARVLLRGETGTGKELFARAYAAHTPRPNGSYVPVTIPALAPTLVESELFGHVKGAFTEAARDKKGRLEIADGGVLFLDEVGDIDPAVQTKLLRFLDSGELFRVGDTQPRQVDALVVSATNRPLERDVEQGRFRADLLARLGHTVAIPPLRERGEDVPAPRRPLPRPLRPRDAGQDLRPRSHGRAAAPSLAVQRARAAAGRGARGVPRGRRRRRRRGPARVPAARARPPRRPSRRTTARPVR